MPLLFYLIGNCIKLAHVRKALNLYGLWRKCRQAQPASDCRQKAILPRRGRIALSANERIAEFLNIAIQAKFAYVNKLGQAQPAFALDENEGSMYRCIKCPIQTSKEGSCGNFQFG